MDLIYEGITTTGCPLDNKGMGFPSEWTWFTKGLRPIKKIKLFQGLIICQNGPDLRRDYDFSPQALRLVDCRQNGPDLRRDYDSDIFVVCQSGGRQNGPDLRRDYDITMGISHWQGLCQNGPDLRRDYDVCP